MSDQQPELLLRRLVGRGTLALFAVFLVILVYLSSARAAGSSVKRTDGGEQHDICAPAAGFWERASRSRYRTACATLDRSRTNLLTRPVLSLELAKSVYEEHPELAGARPIIAHALFVLGQNQQSHDLFSAIESALGARRSVSIPVPHLWASAQAALLVGDFERAVLRYRRLLLQMSVVSRSDERARILIEAGVAALFHSGEKHEALGYLKRAGVENAPLLELVRGALIFVLSEPSPGSTNKMGDSNPPLYWKLLAQFKMLDVETPPGDEARLTWLTLPRGALDWLLLELARTEDPERVSVHLTVLACLSPPVSSSFLSAELKSHDLSLCPTPVDERAGGGTEEEFHE